MATAHLKDKSVAIATIWHTILMVENFEESGLGKF